MKKNWQSNKTLYNTININYKNKIMKYSVLITQAKIINTNLNKKKFSKETTWSYF